jgi:hypothetical protein
VTEDWETGPDAAAWSPRRPAPLRRPFRVEHRGEAVWPLANPPAVVWRHAGIECAIAFGWMNWNGYVRLPKRHPWRTRSYDEIPVAVHGGLTFGPARERRSPGEPSYRPARPASAVGGWVGFDTCHAFDYWPDEELPELPPAMAESRRMLNELTDGRSAPYRVTWSRRLLVLEVERLAVQVAAVPLERPVDAARRRRLTTALRHRERRAHRRARRRTGARRGA